tara:strand:+ start:327 stop:521 length:195 start_codon:yes stop_codon:yes gene_type:complete
LENQIIKEYKSGICDPQRLVAKAEKKTNKMLRAQRVEVKHEFIRANHEMMKLGMHDLISKVEMR